VADERCSLEVPFLREHGASHVACHLQTTPLTPR
jgi:hypothetical protein